MSRQITECPVCDAPLFVTELSCSRCDTRLQGTFPASPLARLPREQQEFIETFVRCRGIIRDVERVLEISYPTVRARLDAAVQALEAVQTDEVTTGASPIPPPPVPPPPVERRTERRTLRRRKAILEQVERGLLGPSEAADALRHL